MSGDLVKPEAIKVATNVESALGHLANRYRECNLGTINQGVLEDDRRAIGATRTAIEMYAMPDVLRDRMERALDVASYEIDHYVWCCQRGGRRPA